MPNEQDKKAVLHKKHVARLQREQQQGRIILYTFFGILAAVVLLLIYGWLDIKFFQANRPVAKVGDAEILVKDFEPRVRLQRQQLLSQYNLYSQYQQFGMDVTAQLQQIQSSLDSPVTVGQTVLDQMVNEELIRQEAAKRGITVDEAELNEAVQAAFNYFPDGTPVPSPTPTQVTLPDAPAEAFAVVTKTPPPTATLEPTATPESAATATATPALPTPTVGPTSTPEPTATPYTLEGFQGDLENSNQRMVKLGFTAGDTDIDLLTRANVPAPFQFGRFLSQFREGGGVELPKPHHDPTGGAQVQIAAHDVRIGSFKKDATAFLVSRFKCRP